MDRQRMIGRTVKTPDGRYGTIVTTGDKPKTYQVKVGAGERHIYHMADLVLVPTGSKLTLKQLSLLDDARLACADLQAVIAEYTVNGSGTADLVKAVARCQQAVEALAETVPELPDALGVVYQSPPP